LKHSGHKHKTLRRYDGGKYVSPELAKFCDNKGIVHKTSAERRNKTIMNMVRCMVKGKHLPKNCGMKMYQQPHTL